MRLSPIFVYRHAAFGEIHEQKLIGAQSALSKARSKGGNNCSPSASSALMTSAPMMHGDEVRKESHKPAKQGGEQAPAPAELLTKRIFRFNPKNIVPPNDDDRLKGINPVGKNESSQQVLGKKAAKELRDRLAEKLDGAKVDDEAAEAALDD